MSNFKASNFVIILRKISFFIIYFAILKKVKEKSENMNHIKYVTVLITAILTVTACKKTNSIEEKTENKPVISTTNLKTVALNVEGMTCEIGCAKTIEQKLSKIEGVQSAKVNFEKKEAEIKFDSIAVNIEKLSAAIESTGDGETYKASEIKSK